MASPDAPRTEQIVSQFLLKALHAILAARIPHLGSSPATPSSPSTHLAARARKRDRWFNLALGDPPSALETLNFWHRSAVDPMVIDIILSPNATPAVEDLDDAVVERWTVRYDPSPNHYAMAAPQHSSASSSSSSSSSSRTYKKSIVLLRSIYALLRLLPAHRAFRMLAAPNHTCNFTLTYRVSSFADPMGPRDEQLMTRHDFTPVEALPGLLSASVTYRPGIAEEFALQSSPLIPPLIIPDYVGSPAADPMRTFPDPSAGRSASSSAAATKTGAVCATSFPLRADRDRSGPSSVQPFTRPHSWTSPPMAHYPLSASPDSQPRSSPPLPVPIPGRQSNAATTAITATAATYSSSSASGSHHPQYHHLHHQFRALSFGGRRSGVPHYYDDYRLSPPSLSASPTPSPPLHPNSPLRNRLHSETAPVSIPQQSPGKSLLQRTPSLTDPMRALFPPPSPRSAAGSYKGEPQTHTQTHPGMGESPSEHARSFRKIEGFRPGEQHISNLPVYAIHKGSKDSKEESGRISGIFSSCGSPRVGFSRSSSRLSFKDDLDDDGLSMPFAMDNIDVSDSQTRNQDGKDGSESSQPSSSTRKSQDAAVGVLVHMLRTAPPLRQDSYSSQSSKSEFGGDVGSSSFMSRKTADALEELRSYKEMKDMLLSQSQSRAKLTDSKKHGSPK